MALRESPLKPPKSFSINRVLLLSIVFEKILNPAGLAYKILTYEKHKCCFFLKKC